MFGHFSTLCNKGLRFFVKTICIEVSANFTLLEFQLKYQVAETLLECQDFFYRSLSRFFTNFLKESIVRAVVRFVF